MLLNAALKFLKMMHLSGKHHPKDFISFIPSPLL